MKICFKKIFSGIVLATFLFSQFGVDTLLAAASQSGKGKSHKTFSLGKKYSGQKLERVKKSFEGRNSYKILIQSTKTLKELKDFYATLDKKSSVKKVGKDVFQVRFPKNSTALGDFGTNLTAGDIPSDIGGEKVLEPEVYKAFDTSYLNGEDIQNTWELSHIGADTFQETLSQLPEVSVGVLDTGIDSTHSDLQANINTNLSYNFIDETSGSSDDNGHGTQVAGIIGASVNGSGIYGVNSSARLVSLKVLDANGLGTSYDFLDALNYAVNNGIKVVNVSFGGAGDPATSEVCKAITDAKVKGVFTIVSAGNSSSDVSTTIPAGCSDAITVGATDHNDIKASFSNYGSGVDVYAPGVDIYTTSKGNTYITKSGTSFSAPLVSGLVSKELAQDSAISYDDIITHIKNNYHLVSSASSVSSSSSTSTGGTSQGTGSLNGTGGTLSGSLQTTPVDYSNYTYYSGTFVQGGKTYGDSLYDNTYVFDSKNLTGVTTYTYDEYQKLIKNQKKDFSALSVSNDGIIGKWDLNGDALDSSGNGNNGIPVNVTWVDSGKGDGRQVASFNGANSFIVSTLSGTPDAVTITMSVKNFSGMAYQDRGVTVLNNAMGFGWGWGDDFYMYSVGDKSYIFSLLNRPEESYFTAVYSLNSRKLYKNGTLIYSDSLNVNKQLGSFYVGLGNFPYVTYLNGQISNVRVYGRELSQAEIQDLYQYPQGTSSSSSSLNNQTSANTNIPSSSDRISYIISSQYACTEPSSAPSTSNATIKQADDTSHADIGSHGDPVNLATGEFGYDNTLMSIPGNGLPFQFDVHYKNQIFYNGPLGVNWDHNYNIYLSEETNGNILFYNGKGGVYRFVKDGTTFSYNEGLKATLQQSGGTYFLTYDSGLQYFFNAQNKVAQIEDRYNNSLHFAYTDGLLTTVTDTLGRTISYTYYDHNRLKDVTDFNGKKVSFAYYDGTETTGTQYDLKSITLDQGNNVTKTISFEYTTGGDDTSNHNLTKLVDSKGQTYVTNVYDANDRVASQTYGDGTISYAYTLNGNLVSKNTVTDKEGHIVEYVYDGNGSNTQSIYHTASGNKTYEYTYNSLGYMTTEKKPNGNGIKYSYDARGNLTEKREKADIQSFDTSADIITTYTYNARNQVLTETLDTGVTTTYTYDSNGNLTQKVSSGLKTSTGATYATTQQFTYGANGLPLTSTDESGKVRSYSYTTGLVSGIVDDVGGLGLTKGIAYDTYGHPLSQTDAKGKAIGFTLNPFGQVLSATTPAGVVTHTEYDANNNKAKETIDLGGGKTKEVIYTYDVLDRVTTITNEYNDGTTVITHIVYDKNGNIIKKYTGDEAPTEYRYDNFGHLIQEKVVPNANDSSQDRVTNYAYDANGNLVTKTDAKGATTTYTYDGFDRLITQTDSLGNVTEWTYFTDNTVHTVTAKDSTGNTLAKTEFVTDGRGKTLKKIVYKNPSTGNETVGESVDYNALGQPVRTVDKKGNITTTAYDTLGRVVSTTDSLGNSVSQTYDANNNIVTKTITPSTGTGVNTTTYAYDDDNRLTSQTNQLGKTQIYAYNALGNIISKTDEKGTVTSYQYDYRGKVLSETKTNGGGGITTSYTYDERGNMTSVVDPNGNTTTYTYNNLNELIKTTYPNGKYVTYTYDTLGNLVSQTDPNGTIITQTYDTLNRLTTRSIQTGSGVLGVTNETYSYDALGRMIQANDTDNHALQFTYDALGNLTSETQSGSLVQYTYDDNANLTSIINPNGKGTNYTYDALNRVTNISQSGSNIATYSYTGILNTDIQYGNNTHITKSYDALNRLSVLHNGLKDYSYTYDDVSNITSDNYKNYTYDQIYRLTQVNETNSGTNLENYTYDNAGNRTSDIKNSSYTVNNLNQYTQVTSSGTTNTNYTYDDNGNLINDGDKMYAYDYKNRLVQVTPALGTGTIVEFKYDVLGRRYEKKTPTKTVKYVYSNENILTEYTTTGNTTTKKEYINGLGTDDVIAVDQLEPNFTIQERGELNFCNERVIPYTSEFAQYGYTNITNRCNELGGSGAILVTNRYYFHKDNVGSIVGISDNSGTTVTTYDYDSYGNAKIASGIDIGNERLFIGREFDSETGLYYNRARYYNPELGRFISQDPIGQVDDVNLYAYVGNNPVNATDPSGTISSTQLWGLAKIGLGGIQSAYGTGLAIAGGAMCTTGIGCAVGVPLAGYGLTQVAAGTATMIDGGVQSITGEESNFADSVDIAGKGIRLVTDSALESAGVTNCTAKSMVSTVTQIGIDVLITHNLGSLNSKLNGFSKMRAVENVPNDFFKGTKYTEKVLKQSTLKDFHGFPKIVDKFAEKYGKVEKFIGDDGKEYSKLMLEGGYKGPEGIFEYIKDSEGFINHRFFNKY